MTGKFPDLFRNCVLWWPGTGVGASPSVDDFPIIPSGVTVTPAGTWTKDDLGNNKSVMKFDGSTNYISLPDNDAWYFGSGDFTICGWIKPLSDGTSLTILACIQDSNNQYYVFRNTSNIVVIAAYYSSAYQLDLRSGSNTLLSSAWTFISVTRTGNVFSLKFNLVEVGTQTAALTIPNFACALSIGRNSDNNTWCNGNIKDLAIYKGRALTLPELKLLMTKTHPVSGTGLVPGPYSYYKVV